MTDISPEAKRLLERARDDWQPTRREVAALDAAIAARITGGTVGGGPDGEGVGPAGGVHAGWVGSSALAKAIGAAVLVSLVGVGFAYRGRSESSPKAPELAAAIASAAPSSSTSRFSESAVGSQVPSVSFADLPSAPTDSRAFATKAPAVAPRSGVGSNVAPAGHPAADPSVETPPASSTHLSLTDEIRLVRGAHAALDRDDPTAALTITEEHESRYPRGTLREENLALRVRALCALGRSGAARDAALALLRTAPDSPYRAGLRASCAGPHLDE